MLLLGLHYSDAFKNFLLKTEGILNRKNVYNILNPL